MTPSDLKRQYEINVPEGHYFERSSMKFFGDTMSNYAVPSKPVAVKTLSGDVVKCWELRRKKPVKHGLQSSAYFNVDTFERVHGEEL